MGRAALSRQRIVVPQVCVDPMALSEPSPDDWLDEGWSLVALPLVHESAIVGVLACYSLEETLLSRDTPLALASVVSLLAVALEGARAPEPSADAEPGSARSRRSESAFDYANMIGASSAMRQIYTPTSARWRTTS